jgi:large subunit ribosomal protein L1
VVHCTIGIVSFETAALKENLQALLSDLQKAKPAAAKGVYMKKVTVSTTQGPGLVVDMTGV